jgi:hypothetical protein
VIAFHILEKGESLAKRAQSVLHACLAIGFGRRVLRFEQRADGLGHVLSQPEDLFGDVCVLLKRFECFAERFASLPRFARR